MALKGLFLLQFFIKEDFTMAEIANATVEGAAGAANTTANNNQQGQNTNGGAQTAEPRTYSEKEFQSEVDKRVTEALKSAQTKWQSDYEIKLKAERDEAAKLAKMSAEERAKAEFDKEREKFNTERSAHQRERLEFECTKQLAGESLPVEFATMLTGADAEATKANIGTFKTAFDKAIEAAVTARMKGSAPTVSTNQNDAWLASVRKGAGLN